MIKEYTTATGSKYLVDHERMRVLQRYEDADWRPCVFLVADGCLVFIESIIPEADPPLYHHTRTSRIVGVRDVPEV